MDERDLQFLERNWKVVPLPVLAKKLSLTPLELTSLLRREGITTDIQPFELEYISENIDRMPASEIQSKLALTTTQFSQVLEKVLGRKRRKSLSEMSLSEATTKTRWLIEERLHFDVDDFLPREITNTHFVNNDLYDCIRFAETEKKKDFLYRHFTAIAFLVCHAYPHTFRPFQFRHAKENEYFKGPGGRKNLINAARWVIEKKMGHRPESLSVICKNKYFLRSKNLQFFGIGSHWFRIHFSSRDEFVGAILKEYQVVLNNARGKTRELRGILTKVGRPPENCEVPGCYFDDEFSVDIHHIVPASASNQISFDINSADNLISLCPNHHRVAGKFNWKRLDLKNSKIWIRTMLEFISAREESTEQVDAPDCLQRAERASSSG